MSKVRVVAPPPRALSREERQEMAAVWPTIACQYCGLAHGGLCPRVRRIRTSRLPNGTEQRDVEFWADGKWTVPDGAISPSQVWDGGVPMPPEPESLPPTKKIKVKKNKLEVLHS